MNETKAREKAQREFAQTLKRRADWANISFLPLCLNYETESFWVFSAASPDLQAQGYIPGAVFFTIDKKDGHRWSNAEIEEYNLAKTAAPELQVD